jgi:hypothetical protein
MSTIADSELLARFITFRAWYRTNDQTVKPDAFMPYPQSVSVTRHEGISDSKIWEIGQAIVDSQPQPRTLHGRADLMTADVRRAGLEVEERPEQTNPNHAEIIDWPRDKPSQKIRAQKLAAVARFTLKPQT